MDFKKYTGYPENFNTNSKNQQFDFSNKSNNKINQNSNTLNFNYQNNSANYNYGSSAIDPNYGIKNYKSNNNNLAQMQIMEKMYKKVEENTDTGKGARQVYDISSFAEAKVKKAYYTNQMDNFGNSYDYSCKNLSQALTNGGYEQGYKFSEIYNHDTNKEIQQFKNAISDNNFNFSRHINTDSIQLTNSFNDMLKTGRVEFTAIEESSNKRISSSYSIDNMRIQTNIATENNIKNAVTERQITGRKWIQSFADATHDRQMKLVKNNNLTNTFLQTDSDLRRFNIQKMSATQLQRELNLLKTNPAKSVFNGFEKQLEATGKIELLQEVVSVKAGSELATRMRKANKNSKRVNKRQMMKFMNKASNGEDAIASFQQLAVGKEIIKTAVKAPVAVNKTYHNIHRKTLQLQINSNNLKARNQASIAYEKLYGNNGKITKRNEKIKKIKDKVDIKGKFKKKFKDKRKTKKIIKKNRRKEFFKVRTPHLSKIFKKISNIKETITNPIKTMVNTVVDLIKKKLIAVISSVITSLVSFILSLLSPIITLIGQIMGILLGFLIFLLLIGGAIVILLAPIGTIIESFKGTNETIRETAIDAIYEELEGDYTDDEIDIINIILDEKSERNPGYMYEDSNNDNSKYGIAALSTSEYTDYTIWASENGHIIEPLEGETDKKGNVNKKYIHRITQIQVKYLKENGYLDEWLTNYHNDE